MSLNVFIDNLRTSSGQTDPTVLEFNAKPSEGDLIAIDLGEREVRTFRIRKVWHHFFKPDDPEFAVSAGLSDGQIIIEVEEVHGMTEAPSTYEVTSMNGSERNASDDR
jgi:hypothetical protein